MSSTPLKGEPVETGTMGPVLVYSKPKTPIMVFANPLPGRKVPSPVLQLQLGSLPQQKIPFPHGISVPSGSSSAIHQ